MKKKSISIILAGLMTLSLVACGNTSDNTAGQDTGSDVTTDTAVSESSTSIANPWRDCTEEEAYAFAPNGFSAPEGATNVNWSIMEVADTRELPGTMVQLTFDMDNVSYVAREQAVGDDSEADISGMYYQWDVEDTGTFQNWAGGMMPYKTSRHIGDDETVDVIRWYDIETGYAYSLSAVAKDLDGFDISAIADQIYDPQKQIGANMPDSEVADIIDEYSNAFIKEAAESASPVIDIADIDTFTQIVDQKLSDGMGYANVTVNDVDLLLVSSAAFDNMDGKMGAIDASVFEYKDGIPAQIGAVCSGGTAYPISVKDGYLYTGSNHWICKYAIANDQLMIMEKASVSYDESGNATYFYESDDGGDYSNFDSAEAEKIFNQLLDEMMSGEVVDFSVVKK
jgi:hypothetical protein